LIQGNLHNEEVGSGSEPEIDGGDLTPTGLKDIQGFEGFDLVHMFNVNQ
jgi:hypothetical protein